MITLNKRQMNNNKSSERLTHVAPSKVAYNATVSMFVNGTYLLSRIIVLPITLAYISLIEYGLWSLCFVILSYASLGGAGINQAYVKFVAQNINTKNYDKINGIVTSGLVSMVLLSGCIWFILYLNVSLLLSFFNLVYIESNTAKYLLLGTAFIFFMDLSISSCFKSILDGIQEVALAKYLSLFTTLVEVILMIFFLSKGMGVLGLLYAFGLKTVLLMLLFVYFAQNRCKWLSINLKYIKVNHLKLLYSYSGKLSLVGMLAMATVYVDKVIISIFLGLEALALYEIIKKIPYMISSIASGNFEALFPSIAASGHTISRRKLVRNNKNIIGVYALHLLWISAACFVCLLSFEFWCGYELINWQVLSLEVYILFMMLLIIVIYESIKILNVIKVPSTYIIKAQLQQSFIKVSRYSNLLNALVYVYVAIMAPCILGIWVGNQYMDMSCMMSLLTVGLLFNLTTGVGTTFLRAINFLKLEYEYLIITLLIFLILIPISTNMFGFVGTIYAIVLGLVIGSLYFMYKILRVLNISISHYLFYTIKPLIYSVLVGIFCKMFIIDSINLFILTRYQYLSVIFLTGFVYLILTLTLTWCFVLSVDEKFQVRNQFNKSRIIKSLGLYNETN